jgi:DNA helicase-2/ATP-dependent DNA helicase PcrA
MQEPVINYTGGKMGVAAVPGSGKTHTLSYLAASLIVDGHIEDDQEILIVTLVNSAVDNFSARVAGFVQDYGLLPDFGYRVRTLHGLAHDIVRERPDLVGLSDRFSIVDENEASDILRSTVATWLRGHPEFINEYANPDIEPDQVYRDQWPTLVVDLAGSIIRKAKDFQVTPADLRKKLDDAGVATSLLNMGIEVFTDYQRALNYRSALDFDDLIRLALQAINTDPDYLARLHYRWPYILEDEAQDSSRLQEEILRKLTGKDGNWVRVGDPNQAIYETFTTASPQYLRNFLDETGVERCTLPNSGRSTFSIIRLANTLIDWTRFEHPVEELRDALDVPLIEPTPVGDPQPNPPDNPQGIHLVSTRFTPEEELQTVVKSIKRWLPDHPDGTVAVLVPRNERGAKLVDELKKNDLDCIELLGSSLSTRQTASLLALILRSLADPTSASKLSSLYRALRPVEKKQVDLRQLVQQVGEKLGLCTRLEEFLWPRPGANWLEELVEEGYPDPLIQELEWLRSLVNRWQAATLLPIDQLVLTIAQDLFSLPADLALAHKLALLLEHASQVHPDWNLKEFTEELNTIARNERKFIGFGEEETGFDPDKHRGKVVVATIHKAKGLEWDRVYLLSVSNYDFPSAQPHDTYISEKWFVRNQLNLPAEALAKLTALITGDIPGVYLEEGQATREARLDYCSERLRLLYVGITRAKKELIITWNTGKSRRGESVPALPLQALQEKGFGP